MARTRLTIVPGNAVNIVTIVNENIVQNLRRRTAPDIELPSLFDRAFMCHYETVVLPVVEVIPEVY